MAWHLVETLLPSTSSVMWSQGERIAFGSVLRLGHRLGLDMTGIVAGCRELRSPRDELRRAKDGEPVRVITVPTCGVDDVVHAVSVWVGPENEVPDPAPVVGSMSVDFESMRVHESLDDYLMHSVSAEGYSSDRDIGMFMSKVIGFPRAAELVEMVTNPESRDRFVGTLTLKHDDGHLMLWQGVARNSPDVLRGFAQDITATEDLVISTPEMARVQLGTTAARSSAVLIGFPVDERSNPVLCYWVSKPPEALENTDIRASWEFHPRSATDLWTAQRALSRDSDGRATRPVRVKMRAPHREWVTCDLKCSKYPAPNVGAGILVAELSLTDR